MSIQFPDDIKELQQQLKTDFQTKIPESNPFLKDSYVGSQLDAYAGLQFDYYRQLNELQKQLFPATADDIEFLERTGILKGVTPNPAFGAKGNVVLTGVVGSSIPQNTLFTATDVEYESLAASTVVNQTITITSLIRVGGTVTAITSSNHGFATNITAAISGAIETEYNGSFLLTVTQENEFQYQITTTPTTPATGTILAQSNIAIVNIQATTQSATTNLGSGDRVTLSTTIPGVDSTGYVDFNEVGGGSDPEGFKSYRSRILEVYQNPVTEFNKARIIQVAKTVSGVTRVFVQEVTPSVGDVTIYFVRDNDPTGIIPSGSEVQDVKDKINEITPAHVSKVSQVFVAAPVPIAVNFVFTDLSPNTGTMQSAISLALQQFFEEDTSVGVDIQEQSYEAAIITAFNATTKEKVISFTLSSPVGNISVSSNEIAVLGTAPVYP